MNSLLPIFACIFAGSTAIFALYLNKAQRNFRIQKLLRGAVQGFTEIPQARGEVTAIYTQGPNILSQVQYADRNGALHFADLVCDQNAVPAVGTQLALRTAEQPVPQLTMQLRTQKDLSPLADRLDMTGMVFTEQRHQEMLAAFTAKQKALGRDGLIYSLMATGAAAISLLIGLATVAVLL